MGKVQITSPIPPNRQMMTARLRCRAHWKASHTLHTIKGAHQSRTRSLKRKNRRHHGLSAECSGPGKIETTNSRKPVTGGIAEPTSYDFQYSANARPSEINCTNAQMYTVSAVPEETSRPAHKGQGTSQSCSYSIRSCANRQRACSLGFYLAVAATAPMSVARSIS